MPDPIRTPSATTIIGQDTHIKGEMTFESTARILGTVEGNISTKGEVQIAEGATCKASIEASRVIVEGTVEGNITARERLELSSKANVKGDLVASKLAVAEGAVFSGHLTVGQDAMKSASATPTGYSSGRPRDDGDRKSPVIESKPMVGKMEGMGVGR